MPEPTLKHCAHVQIEKDWCHCAALLKAIAARDVVEQCTIQAKTGRHVVMKGTNDIHQLLRNNQAQQNKPKASTGNTVISFLQVNEDKERTGAVFNDLPKLTN